jgi:aspartyl-tRNA(Asn)/glutamyl-tRNA(Gln) amidotransferase subunit A
MPVSPEVLTIEDAATSLRDGRVTSAQLTAAALARADRYDGWVGAFLARFDETAMARAEQADKELGAGIDLGLLHGIPIGVKDILAAQEGPTTAQSLVLDPAWGAGKDAPVVRRLRHAGAVIVGKTTTMEFAVGLPEAGKPFPVPVNPWRRERWPGGSSSGTGSGVAAGFFLAGIGSDTGGSIRIPAAFCGVSGLMPTFGRVPKSGCAPLGFSLDHVGPLARSAWDCAAVLQAIAGPDPSDPDSADRPVPSFLTGVDEGITGWRIGVLREHHFDDAEPGVTEVFEAAIGTLGELGAQVVEVKVPLYQEVLAATMVTLAAEACAYHHADLVARWADYTVAARRMVAAGALVSGADYVQAQRVRRVGQRKLAEVLSLVDIIVAPTITMTAPRLDSAMEGELLTRLHTPYWDSVGNPVLAVPIGFVDGLPVSMQVAAAPFAEGTLVRAGRAYQQRTDWHRRAPDLEASHG